MRQTPWNLRSGNKLNHHHQTPLGPWPADENQKQVGIYNRLAIEQDVEGTIFAWFISSFLIRAHFASQGF